MPQNTAQPDNAIPDVDQTLTLQEAVWEFKVKMLEKALQRTQFNQRRAADLLGLTYHQFRGLYRKYQKEKDERASEQ